MRVAPTSVWLMHFFLICALMFPARAEKIHDVALALAVDVSSSINAEERRLQRNGYIEAFRSRDVIRAIQSGIHGSVVVSYFEWAGSSEPALIVPWFVINSAESSFAFAQLLTAPTEQKMDTTSISGAMLFGQQLLKLQAPKTNRRVLDISGDGPNNHGMEVDVARDRLVRDGIVINGLPIMVNANERYLGFDLKSLDQYYQDCVIGGNGAFLVTAYSWKEFPGSLKKKLILEISGRNIPSQQDRVIRASSNSFDLLPTANKNCQKP